MKGKKRPQPKLWDNLYIILLISIPRISKLKEVLEFKGLAISLKGDNHFQTFEEKSVFYHAWLLIGFCFYLRA